MTTKPSAMAMKCAEKIGADGLLDKVTPYAARTGHGSAAKELEAVATIIDAEFREVVEAVQVLLDHVDYTNAACAPTEMVGAVLPVQVITKLRSAIQGVKGL